MTTFSVLVASLLSILKLYEYSFALMEFPIELPTA